MAHVAISRAAIGLSTSLVCCAGCIDNQSACATALVSNRSKTTIVVDSIYDARAADVVIPGTSIAFTGDGCWTSAAEPITLLISTVDGTSAVEFVAPLGGSTALLDVTLDSAGNIQI